MLDSRSSRKAIWARLALLLVPVGALLAPSAARADLVNLGAAGGYAVLGLTGTNINASLVTINGNVGVGPSGSLTNMAPSVINGNVYLDSSASYSGPGHLNGSLITGQNLSPAVAAAQNASATFAAMTPTANVSGGTGGTIVGNGGTNVVNVSGNLTAPLTLTGTAADKFIVNVQGGIALGGNTAIGAGSGVTPGQVVFNVLGGDVNTHVGNAVNGILLDANGNMTLDGKFNNEIIGGGKSITLMSGAVVNGPSPPNTVPAPPSVVLLGLGGALLALRQYRSRRTAV
jgi:hypothetical protein